MQPYLQVFRVTISEFFVYRLNFLLWRFRVVLNLLVIYFLWSAFFETSHVILGYTAQQMITYILVSSIASNFVLASRTQDVAGEIVSGSIINYILKPISFFRYIGARDAADKLVNLTMTIFEISLIVWLLKPSIFIQTNPIYIFLFLLFLTLGVLTAFFISLSLSFVGFWTPEVWGPRFIFYMIVFFLSGSYFPLDILPTPLYVALLTTPFPYLYYLPSRIYLGVDLQFIPLYLFASLFWLFVMYQLTSKIWQKGLRSFSFYGR